MSTTAARTTPATTARIELEIGIDAPPGRVWRAIIDNPDDWWINELRCVAGESTVTLDPHAGGMMVEQSADGGSLLWFTVIAVEPGRSINLAGAIAPPFGGPASAFLLIVVEERDGASVVRITNSLLGHIEPELIPQTESGWRMLFENGLKSFVETGRRK